MHKKGTSLKLTIAGANPSQQVKNLQNESVEVLGWVNSIQEVYHKAKVFVAPLFHGSGLQNKILENMLENIELYFKSESSFFPQLLIMSSKPIWYIV